jgi:beta-fructofuranosidase
MYSGAGFSDWEIGDITVYFHNGEYHLFHLIIPNHDYIAHAVSNDGLSWRRTKNAVFVGDPGEWDDDMLWTMHVFSKAEKFFMYYTGLQRVDKGISSKIGLAVSDDLLIWKKATGPNLPIEIRTGFYECLDDNPRGWLSFRDPFYFEHDGSAYILFCGRKNFGPISRRGCVGLLKLENDNYILQEALIYPGVYDDVECPCIFELHGCFYIIGSIREDVKVRYWVSDKFNGLYKTFHSDFLLPEGNYAARTVWDGNHLLLYNFFFTHGAINSLRVLPPPKELSTDSEGRLILRSFYRWEQMVTSKVLQKDFGTPVRLLKNATANFQNENGRWTCSSESGYEIFYFDQPSDNFIWEGKIRNSGMGKFGFVAHIDQESNGYFVSIDLIEGLIQIRSWGYNPENNRQNFIFSNLQSNLCVVAQSGLIHFKLICYGNYIELSVDGEVRLTLMDYTWSGTGMGLFTTATSVVLEESIIKTLPHVVNEYASQEVAQKNL